MLLPDQKDVVLFPEQVGGRYLAFTRPMPASFGRVLGIWLAESDDLLHWGTHRPVALPRPGRWDEMRIGASLVPIRVDEGWLELYHGADRTNRYGMGALLLDADDPPTVLARTPHPLMVPELHYEQDGFLHDVVFPSGHMTLTTDASASTTAPRTTRCCRRLGDGRHPGPARTVLRQLARLTGPSRPPAPTRSRSRSMPTARRDRRRAGVGIRGRGVRRRRRTAARRAVPGLGGDPSPQVEPGRAGCWTSCCGCRSPTAAG